MPLSSQPSNCFLDSEGRCFLGDFGGATELGRPAKETSLQWLPTDAQDVLLSSVTKEVDEVMLAAMLALGVGVLACRSSGEDEGDTSKSRVEHQRGLGIPQPFAMRDLRRAVEGDLDEGLLKGLLRSLLVGPVATDVLSREGVTVPR